jgi:hypothetical protein
MADTRAVSLSDGDIPYGDDWQSATNVATWIDVVAKGLEWQWAEGRLLLS